MGSKIIYNTISNESKRYGFVELTDYNDYSNLLKNQNSLTLKNNALIVNKAKIKSNTIEINNYNYFNPQLQNAQSTNTNNSFSLKNIAKSVSQSTTPTTHSSSEHNNQDNNKTNEPLTFTKNTIPSEDGNKFRMKKLTKFDYDLSNGFNGVMNYIKVKYNYKVNSPICDYFCNLAIVKQKYYGYTNKNNLNNLSVNAFPNMDK